MSESRDGEHSVERYGLRVEVVRRPRVWHPQGLPSEPAVPLGVGERLVHLCVSALLLAYFGAVSCLAIGGVAWLIRGCAR